MQMSDSPENASNELMLKLPNLLLMDHDRNKHFTGRRPVNKEKQNFIWIPQST